MNFNKRVLLARKKQEKRFFEKVTIVAIATIVLVGLGICFYPTKEVDAVAISTTNSTVDYVATSVSTVSTNVQVQKPDSEALVKQDIMEHNQKIGEAEASNLANQITDTANAVGVSPELLACLFKQESNYNQELENSLGATGLGQITPVCEDHLNSRGHAINRYNRESNILGSAIYLKEMLEMFNYDERLALAAYNAGPGAVQEYGGVPPYSETQHYVKNIMEHKEQMVG